MRSKYATYGEYHTSLDDLSLVSPSGLAGSFAALRECITVLEANRTWVAATPCEPQLGRRGLYPTLSTRETKQQVQTMMDVLAYADGRHDLLALAERIGAPATDCAAIATTLARHGLLVEAQPD
jgi:aminopeptidase-like protein